MDSLWVTTNPIFHVYALCSALLVLKMLGMVFVIAKHRFASKVSSKLSRKVYFQMQKPSLYPL